LKQHAHASIQGYAKAPYFLRLIALSIDGLIAGLPWLLITPLWGYTPLRLPSHSGLFHGFIITAALLWTFYYICFRDSFCCGQSIGKRSVGLMVMGTWTNQPCNAMQSFLRNVIYWVDFFFIVEGLLALANLKTGRRLGDFLAQTQVIDSSQYHRRNLK